MNEFGHFSLGFSWLLSLLGATVGVYSAVSKKRAWFFTQINATVATFLCAGLALGALGWGFVNDDYANQYIWSHSNKEMADIYKISAIWGGMDGSMLLWAVFLTLCGALVAMRAHLLPRDLMPWVLVVLNSSSCFFLTIVFLLTNPFRYIKAPFIPPDGNGLNPLLQNPFMAIHPPTLYLGFTTLAVPYAFCMGALLSGCLSNEWIRLTRRWTLISWSFLTAGIVLGGYWAYIELGWGGFWAWDPVENASFLPWLTATAFLHSVMVQERKNMLRFWNVWLVVLTYCLTVFGTFLTRSGVVQSVHAFASTDIGWTFLLYIGIVVVVGIGLSYWRRKELASERKIESLWSREAAFLLNNLLLLSICFATAWGVMFPVLSEAITGNKQTVGIPFFNAVNVPLFLGLIFLMGVGPLIAWRKANRSSIRKTFLKPFAAGVLASLLLIWAGVPGFWPIVSYGLCTFVLLTVLGELYRGARAQRLQANAAAGATQLLKRHRVRYGGYLVHVGVLIVTVAITASMAHKTEVEFSLAKGESKTIGQYLVVLDTISTSRNKNYEAVAGVISVRSLAGEALATLYPEMRFYFRNKENTTEVALYHSVKNDLYVVLAGLDDSGTRAALKVFINPLQVWLWVGALIMIVGTVVVIIPAPQHSAAPQMAKGLEGERA